MRRADRLFEIIETVRSSDTAITAQFLSKELGVSERTIYRDIAGLQGQGVPIEGEAGVGYVLRPGFHLPPLMFNMEELEAIVLGARLAGQRRDEALERAADRVIAKIKSALPAHLAEQMERVALFAPPTYDVGHGIVDLSQVREAIRGRNKIRISYQSLPGEITERVIWPVAVAFYSGSTLVSAWCETREDFRHFRTDRIQTYQVLDEQYSGGNGRLLAEWKAHVSSATYERNCYHQADQYSRSGRATSLDAPQFHEGYDDTGRGGGPSQPSSGDQKI